ncbi:uncharacterized protein LOC130998579 [Salvia miltiorrhiza]|uniref:uncharacterized protein LOC130998579 n=1 Tax=Salvia miltiorrhiza TaxID=226208 RepID=UPI0025ACC684|nr:uncharacterized protein LOC130998579 [Salvia miltiorrhiza]
MVLMIHRRIVVWVEECFEAELAALLENLKLAVTLSSHIWVELDAAVLVLLMSAGHHGHASIRYFVAWIRLLIRHRQVRFTHIHREGNHLEDFMARQGHQTQALTTFDSESTPRYFLALVKMDQFGYPNFRFRYHVDS